MEFAEMVGVAELRGREVRDGSFDEEHGEHRTDSIHMNWDSLLYCRLLNAALHALAQLFESIVGILRAKHLQHCETRDNG